MAAAAVSPVSIVLTIVICASICSSSLDRISASAISGQRDQHDGSSDLQRTLRLLHRMFGSESALASGRNNQPVDNIVGKRTCVLGAGMTHHCTATLVDKTLSMRDRLRSRISPGKKRSNDVAIEQYHGVDDTTSAGSGMPDVDSRLARCQHGQEGCLTSSENFASVPASDFQKVFRDLASDTSLLRELLYGRVLVNLYLDYSRSKMLLNAICQDCHHGLHSLFCKHQEEYLPRWRLAIISRCTALIVSW